MNYKTCKVIHDNFILDEKFGVFLAVYDNVGNIKKKVPISNPLEKGYVYAAFYFYDEVQRELDKLVTLIRKVHEEILMDINIEDPTVLLLEMSTRVRSKIGDDSLDALIKEELASDKKHIALVIEPEEIEKYNVVREAIFTELMSNFVNITFNNTTDSEGLKTFRMTESYVKAMTDLQKKLLAPAVKMAGFLNQLKLNNFELLPDWSVRYIPERLPEPFDKKEEEIKNSIKKLMEEEFV